MVLEDIASHSSLVFSYYEEPEPVRVCPCHSWSDFNCCTAQKCNDSEGDTEGFRRLQTYFAKIYELKLNASVSLRLDIASDIERYTDIQALLSVPYNEMVRELIVIGSSPNFKPRDWFPSLEVFHSDQGHVDLVSLKNLKQLTKITARDLRVSKEKNEIVSPLLSVQHICLQHQTSSKLVPVLSYFPNLAKLELSFKTSDPEEGILSTIPETCTYLSVDWTLLRELKNCFHLKFLKIKKPYPYYSFGTVGTAKEVAYSRSSWSDLCISLSLLSLSAVSANFTNLYGSCGLESIIQLLFLQLNLKVILIELEEAAKFPAVDYLEWVRENFDFLETHGVEIIKAAAPSFKRKNCHIIYMKKDVSMMTIRTIEYLQHECNWSLDSRLILDKTDIQFLLQQK